MSYTQWSRELFQWSLQTYTMIPWVTHSDYVGYTQWFCELYKVITWVIFSDPFKRIQRSHELHTVITWVMHNDSVSYTQWSHELYTVITWVTRDNYHRLYGYSNRLYTMTSMRFAQWSIELILLIQWIIHSEAMSDRIVCDDPVSYTVLLLLVIYTVSSISYIPRYHEFCTLIPWAINDGSTGYAGQTTGNIWAPKYYIFPINDLPHRPPYKNHKNPEKNPSKGHWRARTLLEFKENFPDQSFTICK